MRILVIDTALGACAAGVFEDDRALATTSEPMTRGHQERLPILAREVMAEAGLSFDSLDRIGVTVGPGSFTGLRVGLAFAKGLGVALDRPVIGLSTLDALALTAGGGGTTVALVDGRRGQVYLRAFRDGEALDDPHAFDLEPAAEFVAGLGPVRLVGDGAAVLVAAASGLADLEVDPATAPNLSALARLTAAADPERDAARPLYLRGPDAVVATRLPGQPRRPAAVRP